MMRSIFLCTLNVLLTSQIIASTGDFVGKGPQTQVTVDRSGGANANVEIKSIKPGNGFNFPISLNYSSHHSSLSDVGYGWNLSPKSSISRCRKSKYLDGQSTNISLNTSDALCLNGKRLVLVRGQHFQDGAIYRLRSENFTKVTLVVESTQDSYFLVQEKSGNSLKYGFSESDRDILGTKVLRWYLSSVQNRAGNEISFSYKSFGTKGIKYLSRISYGGNVGSQTPPYLSIEFNYKESSNPLSKFVAGYEQQYSHVLSNIKQFSRSDIAWEYKLNYQNLSGNRGNLLKSVQRCFPNQKCMPSAKFDYSEDLFSVVKSKPGNRKNTKIGWRDSQRRIFDVDDDGYEDIVSFNPKGLKVQFGHKDDFGPAINMGIKFPRSWSSRRDPVIIKDLDNDGFRDILTTVSSAHGHKDKIGIYVAYGYGRGFESLERVNRDFRQIYPRQMYLNVIDMNQDHKPDILLFNNSGVRLLINMGRGNGFTPAPDDGYISRDFRRTKGWEKEDPKYLIDLNADGITDLVGINRKGVYASLGKGNLQYEPLILWNKGFRRQLYNLRRHSYDWADMNADGLIDLVGFHNDGVKVGLNTGTEILEPVLWLHDFGYKQHWFAAKKIIIDINSDGFQDIIAIQKGNSKGRIKAYMGFGRKFEKNHKSAVYFQDRDITRWARRKYPMQVTDLDNDTKADFTFLSNELFKLKNNSTRVLLEKITDGFGNQTLIEYKSSSDQQTYQKREDQEDDDMQIMPRAGLLVSKISQINSHNHKKDLQYKFIDAVFHPEGLGFLGFKQQEIWDRTNSIKTIKSFSYNVDSMMIGLPIEEQTYQVKANGTLNIKAQKSIVWDRYTYNTSNHQFLFIKSQSLKSYSDDGQVISQTNSESVYDDFGNILKTSSSITSDDLTTETITEHTYEDPDLDLWMVDLMTHTKIVQKKSGFPDIVSNTSFAYSSEGLMVERVKEPGTSYELKEEFSRSHSLFNSVSGKVISWHPSQGKGINATYLSTSIRFDMNGFARESIDAEGHSKIILIRDPIYFRSLKTKDEQGLIHTVEYNIAGQITSSLDPFGVLTTKELVWCNEDCPNAAVYYTKTKTTNEPDQIEYFDSEQNVVRSQTQSIDGQWSTVDYTYNQAGELSAKSLPYFEGDDRKWIHFTYDEHFSYTKEVAYPDGTLESKEVHDLTIKTVDRNGQATTKVHNAIGKIQSITDAAGGILSFEYDSRGRKVKSIDSEGHVTRFEYDLYNRRTLLDDPSTGVTRTEYNALNKAVLVTDAESTQISSNFDIMGRLIQQSVFSHTQGESSYHWNYVKKGPALGQIESEKGQGYEKTYLYDTLGRVLSKSESIQGQEFTSSYRYDQSNRVSKKVYPSGFAVKYDYNAFNYLNRVMTLSGQEILSEVQEMDASGNITKRALGNGQIITQDFDLINGGTTLINTHTAQGQAVSRKQFAYDAVGNLISRSVNGAVDHFQYDSLNRLTNYIEADASPITVRYSLAGNIQYRSDIGDYQYGESCGGVTPGPFAVSSVADKKYCYDRTGQMIRKGDTSLSYRHDGLLTQIKDFERQVDFLYSPSGKKVFQKDSKNLIGEKSTYFVGGDYQEIAKEGSLSQLHFVDEHVLVSIKAGELRIDYLSKDHLGSTREVYDSLGHLIETSTYNPWGLPHKEAPKATNGVGFTGHSHFGFDQLVHMKGRVYDPVIGRFLSPDPYVQEPGLTQNYNRYSYVLNNPLSYTDPSGYMFSGFKISGHDILSGKVFADGAHRLGNWVSKPKNQRLVAAVGITALTGYGVSYFIVQNAALVSWQVWALGSVASGMGGYASGYVASNGNSDYARQSAFTAAASFGIGEFVPHSGAKIIAHGTVGGLASQAQGGSFESGFKSSAINTAIAHSGAGDAIASGLGANPNNFAYLAISGTIIGGTTSELTGGTFEQGATTSVIQNIFNKGLHRIFQDEVEKLWNRGTDPDKVKEDLSNFSQEQWEKFKQNFFIEISPEGEIFIIASGACAITAVSGGTAAAPMLEATATRVWTYCAMNPVNCSMVTTAMTEGFVEASLSGPLNAPDLSTKKGLWSQTVFSSTEYVIKDTSKKAVRAIDEHLRKK